MEENREKEVMEVSLQAGHLLLENGAEISRVEETMDRICNYYGCLLYTSRNRGHANGRI